MKYLLTLALGLPLFAGQDLDLTTQTAGNASCAAQPNNQSFTVEGSFNGYDTALGNGLHIASPNCVGLDISTVSLSVSDIRLQFFVSREVVFNTCQLQIADAPSLFFTWRFIHDAATSTNTCQSWDINGLQRDNVSYSSGSVSGSNSAGAALAGGGSGEHIKWSYFRIYTTALSTTAKPPTTAQDITPGACVLGVSLLLDMKFDTCNNTGTLVDLSGNAYTFTMSSGSPTYTNTPGQTLVKALLLSTQASTIPARLAWLQNYPKYGIAFDTTANHTNHLDCSNSYSQADLSNVVTCLWSSLAGPNTPTITSTSSVTPTVSGLIDTRIGHVDYNIQLVATDVAANTGTSTQHIGAVPMDANGVVVNDAATTQIFGPMIALGYNPWGYQDERSMFIIDGQVSTNPIYSNIYSYGQTATWTTKAAGTISYPFSGKGAFQACTTLSAGISATDTTIQVADASCLSLGNFPTWIFVGTVIAGQAMEQVCISGADHTTGAATLTTCYDGRGLSEGFFFQGHLSAASIWPINTQVGEMKLAGSSTLFATDPDRPLCPAGVPGPPGPVTYSTGTVRLAASSATVIGSGTTWNAGNGVIQDYMIRVQATHGGGTPFIWWGKINAVGGVTSITANRPAPADVDTSTDFNYKVTSTRYFALGACSTGTTCSPTDPQAINVSQNSVGCSSETAAYAAPAHDITALNAVNFTGMKVSYKADIGAANAAAGANFYGSGLAERAIHLRSGLTQPYTNANLIDEIWVNDPDVCSGFCLASPLAYGGGVIGAIADKVTNSATALQWGNLEQFASVAVANSSVGCNNYDTRDSAIFQGWIALLAIFDPSASWQTGMTNFYNRDVSMSQPITGATGCKGADNSWGNGSLWNGGGPAMDVTQGSAVVAAHVGGTFSAAMCNGATSGTATATNGSAALAGITGTFQAGAQIVVTGLLGGNSFTLWTGLIVNSGSSATMGALWPGTTGTVTWLITSNDLEGNNVTTIAASIDDPLLLQNWSCTYNNTSQITLHKVWTSPAPTAGTLHMYKGNLSGYNQQAFMLAGYKESALRWGSFNPDATIAANYAALLPLAATWIHDTGYDAQSKSMNYGRLAQACEPLVTASAFDIFWKVNDCQSGGLVASIRAGRTLNAEATNGLSQYYLVNTGDAARKTYADQAYGAIWGYCPWTEGGGATYYCDANYVRDEVSDASLSGYKWAGFTNGVGVGHQWPAVRTDVAPPTDVLGVAISGPVSIRGNVVIK